MLTASAAAAPAGLRVPSIARVRCGGRSGGQADHA
jgi:hypothetical protein